MPVQYTSVCKVSLILLILQLVFMHSLYFFFLTFISTDLSKVPKISITFCVFSDIVNTTIDEVSVTMTTFEPTKKMSTYLLAIVVSDYAHIRNVQEDILVTIW